MRIPNILGNDEKLVVGDQPSSRIWILLLILAVFGAIASVRLHLYPHPWGDEAFYMDIAQHILQEGRIASGFFSQMLQMGRHIYIVMPGYVLLLAGVFKVLGYGLGSARALSVIFGIASVGLTYLLGERLWGWRVGLTAAALMVANHQVVIFSRQAMPEIVTMAFGLAALVSYLYGLERGALVWFWLSGLTASLAYLCHPLGLPVMGGLTVWSWLDRRGAPRRAWMWLAAGAAMVLVPYIFYVLANPQEYLAQTVGFYTKATKAHQGFLANIIREVPARYFGITKPKMLGYILAGKVDMRYWLPQVGLVGLVSLAGLFVALIWAPGKGGGRLASLLALFALFMALLPNKFPGYLVMLAPFVSLVLAGLAFRWESSSSGDLPRRLTEWAVLSVAGAFALSQVVFLAWNLTSSPILKVSYFEQIEKMRSLIPKGSSVLADQYYWIGLNDGRRFITTKNFVYALEKKLKLLGRPYEELNPNQRQGLVEETFESFRPKYLILTKVHGMEAEGRKKLSREVTVDVDVYLSRRARLLNEWPLADGYKNYVEHFWKGVSLYRILWETPGEQKPGKGA